MENKKIAIVSLHTPNFQTLADYTWPNKVEYAERHGYRYFCKTDGFTFHWPSGEKFPMIKQYLLDNPDTEWVWWVDTDTLITDYTKRVEEFLDDDYHFIIGTDVDHNPESSHNKDHRAVNAGSFFVRNSSEAHAYLDWMLSVYEEFEKEYGWWTEQRIIDASCNFSNLKLTWKKYIKICPQHWFNSFDCEPRRFARDLLGERANWEPGDFLVHWPGVGMDTRMRLVGKYLNLITK